MSTQSPMATLRMASPWQDPRTGIYYFRRRIPERYRGVCGQKGEQFKISLKTKDPASGRGLWGGALAQWDAKVAEWERRLNVVVVTPEAAKEIAAKWAAWIAADLTRLDCAGAAFNVFDDPTSPEAMITAELGGRTHVNGGATAIERLKVHAGEATRLAGIEVAPESEGHLMDALKPVAAAAYRQASLTESGLAGAQGDRWNPLRVARAQLPSAPDVAPVVIPAPPTVSLKRLFDGWRATATVKARTVDETDYNVKLLAAHVGHDDAAKIDATALRGWRDLMKSEGRSNNTWNNRLSLVGRVLAWGVAEGLLASNPADGIRLPKSRNKSPLPYTDEEAATILNAARKETRQSLRWAHWVQAFTGMRAGEVLQLTAKDIRQAEGVWFIAVHEDDAAKSVKTGQRRNVPVHPALVAEGFIAYAQTIKDDDPLFPDKKPDKHGNRGGRAWNVIGKWVRETVGITDPLKAPDHSWRHRVEDDLRAAEVPEDARDAIVGHARKTTGRQYGVRGESLKRLHRHVSQIPVPAGVVIPGMEDRKVAAE